MFVMFILVILVTWALIKYILVMYHNESYVKDLKCKQPFIPFFGNVISIIGMSSTEIFNEFIRFATQNETPLKMYIGPKLIIILDKPKDLKAVLNSTHCFDKPYVYGFYPCPQGISTEQCTNGKYSIFFYSFFLNMCHLLGGVLWKRSRKLINPCFNLKTLQSFIPIFYKKTMNLVDELKDHVERSGIDIMPYAAACSLDAILATVMGLDIDLKSNKGQEFIDSLTEWVFFTFILFFAEN